MKRCNSNQSFALVALVAIVGGYIGASASSAYVMDNGYDHQSQRSIEQNVFNLENALRVQERRNVRLQDTQEAEAVHAAAQEEADDTFDARAHFRAYRECLSLGYTRSRLHSCIESMLVNGEYWGY